MTTRKLNINRKIEVHCAAIFNAWKELPLLCVELQAMEITLTERNQARAIKKRSQNARAALNFDTVMKRKKLAADEAASLAAHFSFHDEVLGGDAEDAKDALEMRNSN